ncbi:hypothetical protein FOA52_009617 [Chlamydomonas sp. UWO 241]|nr:hypothetical protein FOA52_009617 [Chlamydomonas sp. UWO 241]
MRDEDRPSWDASKGPATSALSHGQKHHEHARFADGVADDAAHQHQSRNKLQGNEVAMKKIVEVLYARVLADPELKPFFASLEALNRIKVQQEVVMAMVFGGSDLVESSLAQAENPEVDMRRVHMRPIMEMGLGVSHWERYVGHFKDTLAALKDELPPDTAATALKWMMSTRDAFLPLKADEVEWYRTHKGSTGSCPFSK